MNQTPQKNLTELYREFDARCAREAHKLSSRKEYEETPFIPSPGAKDKAKRAFSALLCETGGLPAPDGACSLLRDHFAEFLKAGLSDIETTFNRPSRFVAGLTDYVDFLGRQDSRDAPERARLAVKRIATAEELWDGVRSLMPGAGPAGLKGLEEACSKLSVIAKQARENVPCEYKRLPASLAKELGQALVRLQQLSLNWGGEVSAAIQAAADQAEPVSSLRRESSGSDQSSMVDADKVDPDAYRAILSEELGINLDELLAWHEDEVRSTREDVFKALNRINLGQASVPEDMAGVVEILNRFAGPCGTPAEMFARMRSYLDRAQRACREFVRLPEESVKVVPTPRQYRDSYPWGGYGGGCPKRRPLLGEVFLNDGNYRAITDGWIKVNAVHECYPGHHVQWVRATLDPLPETIKMGARGVPLLEGACVRTERLMEPVFPEDPFYPLFVAYRRHHTATRIKADLYLQYFGRPAEDAVDLYVEEMGFDPKTARGQVKAQQLMIGYFNCYYYGLKRITDLQARFGLDDKAFTETIFGLPHVSLATLEKFLTLSAVDKERVLADFPSFLPS